MQQDDEIVVFFITHLLFFTVIDINFFEFFSTKTTKTMTLTVRCAYWYIKVKQVVSLGEQDSKSRNSARYKLFMYSVWQVNFCTNLEVV